MQTTLRNTMTKHIITIDRAGTAAQAMELMRLYSIRHLPVVSESHEFIVGMLSDRDLLRAPHKFTPVQELMSTPVKTFDISTPCRKIVQEMIDAKMSSFIVTDHDEIVGIVTSEDMLILLGDFLDNESSSKHLVGDYLNMCRLA